jgi:hypothetical protein
MAVSMKGGIFWHVTYSLVEVYRRLGGMYCLHFQSLIVIVFLFPIYFVCYLFVRGISQL